VRIRTLCVFLFLVSASFLVSYGQTSGVGFDKNRQTGSSGPESPLRLTTSIIKQSFCPSYDLTLTLKLHYTNVADTPLILFKYDKIMYRSLVSRNLKDAAAKRYKADSQLFAYSVMDYSIVDTPTPGSLFTILKQGESFETKQEVVITVNDGVTKFARKALKPGDYVLEIRTSNWGDSLEHAERLSNSWKQYGDFWFKDIKSQPMPFRIDKEPRVVNCSN
jgi:hypothetical protein